MKYSVLNFKSMAKVLTKQNRSATFVTMLIVAVMSESLTLLQQAIIGTENLSVQNQILSIAVSILTLLIVAPANVGSASVFSCMAQNQPANAGNLFLWYGEAKKLKRAISLSVLQSLIMTGWILAFGAIVFLGAYFVMPSVFENIALASSDPTGVAAAVSILQIYFLFLISAALAYIMFCVYMPATYILAADPEKTARQCLRESKSITKPVRFKLIALHLVFFLQIIGIAILLSFASVFLSGGNQAVAVNITLLLMALATFFYIMPQFHLSTILFINHYRVGQDIVE